MLLIMIYIRLPNRPEEPEEKNCNCDEIRTCQTPGCERDVCDCFDHECEVLNECE